MKKLMTMVAAGMVALAAQAYWTPVQLNLFGYVGLPPGAENICPLRINLIYGGADEMRGLDIGLVNRTGVFGAGIRSGLVNWSQTRYCGYSEGLINIDDRIDGVNVGLINFASDLNGVELGLININLHSFIPIFPLINIGL